MNRIGLAGALSAAVMTLTLAMPGAASAESKFQCKPDETYVMNVMVSAHPYWVPVYQGFKQAAAAMGCKTVFSGTPDYDIAKQIASFEQDLIKKPAGVLLHPMQADPFIEPIDRAIENGTTVVTFAADSPKSKRVSYITSDNLAEAKFAAEEIVKQVGDDAEYGVLENPGQSNHDLRVTAFIDYLAKNYPKMKLVGRQASNQDANVANKAVASMLQANPNLKALWIPEAGSAEGAVAAVLEAKAKVLIMHADITPATLEQIKAGNIHMALSPNQGMQGYLGFVATFMAAHPELIDPFNDYKTSGYNPMSIPFADNGFAVITKENADSFDLNKYMAGRDPS
ncbi:substrate-binding domain-containing protein [Mesorhizobium sp. WSM4303]|uniref:substrate-binding domain-containing protein n=1 Tax=unclassified Mesorhizobium TaxID=325217 RepID=UPI00115E3FC3|nr:MULTISPECIES: substrate-binding domain-containing protein [unclassified Mesorhizobium]TRC96436.1 substrate-binding domain-containing protein [Mesorhizobium sp. WSM4306]TRD06320.1 substrate-binding domain-containing protein [Mesorhizobium sp. WSM4303]